MSEPKSYAFTSEHEAFLIAEGFTIEEAVFSNRQCGVERCKAVKMPFVIYGLGGGRCSVTFLYPKDENPPASLYDEQVRLARVLDPECTL